MTLGILSLHTTVSIVLSHAKVDLIRIYCAVLVFRALCYQYDDSLLLVSGRMYALQKGMQLDKSSPDAKKFLYALMDLLEQVSIGIGRSWKPINTFTIPLQTATI